MTLYQMASWRPRYVLIFPLAVLFAMGLVMIYNTTSAEVLEHDLSRTALYEVVKQAINGVLGVTFAYVVVRRGVHTFLSASSYWLIFLTALLVLCFIPPIGREVNGSHRWLNLGFFTVQPSEFVKLFVPAFFIFRWMKLSEEEKTFRRFIALASLLFIPILLILIEPNNGTAGVILFTLIVLCFLLSVSVRYWAVPLGVFTILGAASIAHLPYVQARLKVYWNPELDLKGKGHQPYQAKIAAGSGGLLGKGPGNGLQKLSYLPEAQNDYIAAIFAEEFGFIGISSLIFLYMLITYLGFTIAYQAHNPSLSALAAAVTFLLSFQAFLNLGVVSGLLPSTGLNLPFFSQGGTSLMANFLAVGVLWGVDACPKS